MRKLLATWLCLVFFLCGGRTSARADTPSDCFRSSFGVITCVGVIPGQPGGVVQGPATGGGTGPVIPMTQMPALVPGPAGGLCVTVITVPLSPATPVGDLLDRLWLGLLASHNVCPGVTLPANLTPAIAAEAFWESIPLPVPKPYVAPGWAITGKPSYLETRGTLHPAAWTTSTPLGPLSITATGSYGVDWGDGPGAWAGPYNLEGAPWPKGVISHTYDNVGTYTVRVLEVWTARWTLGGQSGTLRQLLTQAIIPNFTVRQVQAVITG
jgi:hypothetical protein